jgi:hypothetical protein
MSLARVSLGSIAPLLWPEGDNINDNNNNNNNNNNDNNSPRQNSSNTTLVNNNNSTLVNNNSTPPDDSERNHRVYGSAGGDAMLCDLLTDAAAVGLMQAENRPPSGQW